MKQSRIILMLGLLSLILALGGLVPGVVAQDSLELESLSIALWPEFDQPEMLVIYQGSLAPETALPAAVEIRIPARVGRPTAMAFLSAAGERLNQQYTTRVEGEFVIVSFELTATGFQLEYYDDLPVQDDLVREYDFAYTADYAIADLSVEFQLPRTGEGLTVEPQEGVAQAGTDGLLYHRLQREAVEAAETFIDDQGLQARTCPLGQDLRQRQADGEIYPECLPAREHFIVARSGAVADLNVQGLAQIIPLFIPVLSLSDKAH